MHGGYHSGLILFKVVSVFLGCDYPVSQLGTTPVGAAYQIPTYQILILQFITVKLHL